MTQHVTTQAQPLSERASAVAPAALAILAGLFLLFGAGFAQPQTLHNAAHDGRHAFAFPCH
jgi:cobalt transporter subunit CbtB